MMDAKFCWFAPTSGDVRYLAAGEMLHPPDVHYMVDVARKAELAGFDDILIPVCSECLDPLMTAAFILQGTKKINALVAYKLGMCSPQVLGTSISTLNSGIQNRVHLNIVQGDLVEGMKQGLNLPDKSELPVYLEEFVQSLSEIIHAEFPVNFEGRYIKYKQAVTVPRKLAPKLFLGGGFHAMKVAARYCDYYLTFGDSVENIRRYAQMAKELARTNWGRQLKVGIGINIVARKTTAEAMEECERLISKATKANRIKARYYYMKNNSIGNRSYAELEAKNFLIDTHVWAGFAKVRIGPVATIFGSYQEVADKIKSYYEAGVEYFSLTGYPLIQEVERVGTVLDLLR